MRGLHLGSGEQKKKQIKKRFIFIHKSVYLHMGYILDLSIHLTKKEVQSEFRSTH